MLWKSYVRPLPGNRSRRYSGRDRTVPREQPGSRRYFAAPVRLDHRSEGTHVLAVPGPPACGHGARAACLLLARLVAAVNVIVRPPSGWRETRAAPCAVAACPGDNPGRPGGPDLPRRTGRVLRRLSPRGSIFDPEWGHAGGRRIPSAAGRQRPIGHAQAVAGSGHRHEPGRRAVAWVLALWCHDGRRLTCRTGAPVGGAFLVSVGDA